MNSSAMGLQVPAVRTPTPVSSVEAVRFLSLRGAHSVWLRPAAQLRLAAVARLQLVAQVAAPIARLGPRPSCFPSWGPSSTDRTPGLAGMYRTVKRGCIPTMLEA